MEHVAPAGSMYQAGTLSGNPLAMRAGIETMKILSQPGQVRPTRPMPPPRPPPPLRPLQPTAPPTSHADAPTPHTDAPPPPRLASRPSPPPSPPHLLPPLTHLTFRSPDPPQYEKLDKNTKKLITGILDAGKEAGHAVCGGHISGMLHFSNPHPNPHPNPSP